MFISIATGLIAGLVHVLSGPDHLAAVAPLAVHGHRRAWQAGWRWGAGHATGVLVIGGLALLLRGVAHVEIISAGSERLVGIMLIGIGLWGFKKAFSTHLHAHEHTHHGEKHVHYHVHAEGSAHSHHSAGGTHQHSHAAFWVGGLHGMAGGSHFYAILPALAFAHATQAAVYLLSYGLGTIAAMMIFSSVLGATARYLFAANSTRAYQALMTASSVIAVMIGAYWLVS